MAAVKYRWPEHWYHDQYPNTIKCIVPNCGFFTSAADLGSQWTEIRDHCVEPRDAEHGILGIMVRQTRCVIEPCNVTISIAPHHKLRFLLYHERTAHGSDTMSHIESFVTHVRESRIRVYSSRTWSPDTDAEKFAFYRMMEKVQALPASHLNLLFQRSGVYHPSERTSSTLAKILTDDPLKQPGDNPPFWWPVRDDHFLYFCRPDPNNPADDNWRVLWTNLRELYAQGHI